MLAEERRLYMTPVKLFPLKVSAVLGTSFIHDLIKAVKHLMNMTNSMELSPS
jgi:hypothetical protein